MINLKKIGYSLALATMAAASPVLAEYPERPVEFVVPWPPGDIEDTLTRMIADAMRNETGVPASTVNIAGGGGLVGATHVFSQPADGYTVGVFTANIISVHIMRGNAKYDRAEFEPIAAIIGYGQLMEQSPDLPQKYKNNIQTIKRSGSHLLGMIDDILDVWFDSGVTHHFVVDSRDDIPASAD